MKILHISDTHGQHGRLKDLPAADVIVHSGDFTFGGEVHEAIGFLNWFCDLPYAHKIFIAGNHDDCLYMPISMVWMTTVTISEQAASLLTV